MTKEERWRMEGMAFCLRYLDEHDNDVEGMKKEIKRRGAGSIPLALSKADENRILFDDEDGKRHVIYYPTGTIIIDEK